MGDIQQRHLRFQPLIVRSALLLAGWLVIEGFLLSDVLAQVPNRAQPHIPLSNLRSGRAIIRQQDRVTYLDFTPRSGGGVSIPLTHVDKYPQWTDGPYKSHLIAELPNKLLIFTDTLSSNPTNIQGECGASPTGERFLHIVSLSPPVRETLSLLIDSCLLDLTPRPRTPVFDSTTGKLIVGFLPDHGGVTKSFHIAPDGSATAIDP